MKDKVEPGTIGFYNLLNVPVQTTDKTEAHHIDYYSGLNNDYRGGTTCRFHRLQHLSIHAWLILYGKHSFPKVKEFSKEQITQIFTELSCMIGNRAGFSYTHPQINDKNKEYKYQFKDTELVDKFKQLDLWDGVCQMVNVARKYQDGWMLDYKSIKMEKIKTNEKSKQK